MKEYIEINFPSLSPEQKDILIAELAGIGYEGFEETDAGLKAFIPLQHFDEPALKQITASQKTEFIHSTLPETNWNKVWESNFEPVIIDDFVAIRADFHEPIKGKEHELIITPKMSFGTGHHATTSMMIAQMRNVNFKNKDVFDFGTGTGVLAILAEKLGAKRIIATDIDDWSIDNAGENISRNNCSRIDLRKTDNANLNDAFDIILANINKNVILDNLSFLAGQLRKGGMLFLSGIIPADENDVFHNTSEYSLQLIQRLTRDNWLFLSFSC